MSPLRWSTPEPPVLVGEFPPDARETVAELIKERDTAEGAAMYADEQRAAAEKDCTQLAEQRDALVVERDALRAELADLRQLRVPPPERTKWVQIAPPPPEQPLPQPVHDTWAPPPLTDWVAWEKSYDAARAEEEGDS